MATTQKQARLHRFHEVVGLSFPDTEQLYLTPAVARALAKELKRFADACELPNVSDKRWPVTRLVHEDGLLKVKTVTESTGKAKVEYV